VGVGVEVGVEAGAEAGAEVGVGVAVRRTGGGVTGWAPLVVGGGVTGWDDPDALPARGAVNCGAVLLLRCDSM
jgi:hypothetical protein